MRRFEILLAIVAVAAVFAAPSLAGAQALGLVAYWPLSETSGTTAYDASGNGHNATAVTADGASNCVPPTSGAPGLFGYAWHFYGTPSNVSALEVTNLTGLEGDQGSLNASFNCWLYIPSSGSNSNLQPRVFQIDEMYQFGYVNDCSRTYFYMHNGVGADISNHQLQFNQWEMYTGTYNYNSGSATIYLNGNVVVTNPNAGEWNNTAPQAAGEPLALSGEVTGGGTESGGNSVNGLMDDAGIWNVTLSQTQVQAMYNTEMVPGLQATDLYGQGTMARLFSLYSAETGSVKVGNLTWKYATGLSGGAGNAWGANGVYYIQLGNDSTGLETAAAPIPGDANGDGRVDINDLTIVLTNFGQTGRTWSQGAMDGDPTGMVDLNDLTIVLANFGTTSGAGLVAVPEPSCVVLLGVGAIGWLAFALRR